MAASNAVGGHNIQWALNKDGDPDGTYTVVAELRGRLTRGKFTRSSKEITPHGNILDEYIVSPVKKRENISLAGNFVESGATHDELTGFQKLFFDNTYTAMQFQGTGFVAGSVDDFICSGYIVSMEMGGGDDAEEYDFALEFRPSGPYSLNGTEVTP